MKIKKIKKILGYGLLIVLGLVGGFMLSKMYMSSSSSHDHSSGKDGCHCECEFKSNQNEKSCKDHGGCRWTGSKCITE